MRFFKKSLLFTRVFYQFISRFQFSYLLFSKVLVIAVPPLSVDKMLRLMINTKSQRSILVGQLTSKVYLTNF